MITLSIQFRYFYLSIVLIFYFLPTQAQKYPKQEIVELDSLSKKLPSAIIYLQTDKGIYETGEDLWFKAYVLNAQYLTNNSQDSTLYIALIEEDSHKIIAKEKYAIFKGFANGHIWVNDSISPGNYLLAAFSAHSFFKNQDEFKTFRKIRIMKRILPQINLQAIYEENKHQILVKLNRGTEELRNVAVKIQVYQHHQLLKTFIENSNSKGEVFFMIADTLRNKEIFCKITSNNEDEEVTKTLSISKKTKNSVQFDVFPEGGNLVNGLHSVIAFKAIGKGGKPMDVDGHVEVDGNVFLNFKSEHDGMGKFELNPQKGKHYTLKIDKVDSVFNFPDIHEEGLALRLIQNNNQRMRFILTKSKNLQPQQIYVVTQIRGKVCGLFEGNIEQDSLLFDISTTQFPMGLAEVTIYDKQFNPLIERLVAVNFNRKLYIQTQLTDSIYNQKDKITLHLKATDEQGKGVIANLSLSIFDSHYENPEDQFDILSYSHLFKQLKGNIYRPDYYFGEQQTECLAALDLLMLTQGWRKYVWNKEQLELLEQDISVTQNTEIGILTHPNEQQMVVFFPSQNQNQKVFVPIDKQEHFTIEPQDLATANGGYLYVKLIGKDEENKESKIEINNPFANIAKALNNQDFVDGIFKSNTLTDTMSELPIVPGLIALNEVVIKGKQTNINRDKYLGSLDSIAKLDASFGDYVGECGILNCPAEFTNIRPLEGKRYSKYIGKRTFSSHPFPFSASEMVTIVYQYPKYTDEQLMVMFNLTRTKGYAAEKEFYEPKYDQKLEERTIPDFRNVLVWKPEIMTNEKGEASVVFFTSDIIGKFNGKLEGIGGTGLLGTNSFKFYVTKENPYK